MGLKRVYKSSLAIFYGFAICWHAIGSVCGSTVTRQRRGWSNQNSGWKQINDGPDQSYSYDSDSLEDPDASPGEAYAARIVGPQGRNGEIG